jgi:DUF4097 and DUF4098 domain-containing protein YvlB
MRILSVVAITSLVLTMAGCSDLMGLDGYEASDDQIYVLPAEEIDSISLENVNGDVYVYDSENDSVHIEATRVCLSENADDMDEARELLDNLEIFVDETDSGYAISTEFPQNTDDEYSINFVIHIPKTVSITVEMVNGRCSIMGLESRVTVANVNGNVTCALDEVHEAHPVSMTSVNGLVRLDIPSDSDVNFDLATVNGEVTVFDFDEVVFDIETDHRMTGVIGDGGARVELTTTNGNVRLYSE